MRVAVIGTGYVGLVTGACLASAGHRVICVDSDARRAAMVARGDTPIVEDGLPELVKDGIQTGRLSATTGLTDACRDAEVILICVGTPTTGGAIQLDGVAKAALQIGEAIRSSRHFPVVAVKSTVTPGTTGLLVRRALETASGGRVGELFGLAMNPEFLSQGSAVRDFLEADRIVVGAWDDRSAEPMAQLYHPFPAPLLRMGLADAEMVKYAANALQATLISYANQIAGICEATPGVDHARVMRAVHLDRMLDGPDGGRAGAVRFLMGGIGFGGSCFPKDLVALAAHARAVGADPVLIDAVTAINTQRPEAAVRLLEDSCGGLMGRRIAVLGLAFKPGTDDLRESPAIKIARRLLGCGCEVVAHDPLPIVRQRARGLLPDGIAIADTAEGVLAGADAAIIATAWPEYRSWDWPAFTGRMRSAVLLDGRGVLDGLDLPPRVRVIRPGTGPEIVGRENA